MKVRIVIEVDDMVRRKIKSTASAKGMSMKKYILEVLNDRR